MPRCQVLPKQTPHLCKDVYQMLQPSEAEKDSRKRSLAIFTGEGEPEQSAAYRCPSESIGWKGSGQDRHLPSTLRGWLAGGWGVRGTHNLPRAWAQGLRGQTLNTRTEPGCRPLYALQAKANG